MPLDFPASPFRGQVYLDWIFDGQAWTNLAVTGEGGIDLATLQEIFLPRSGGDVNGPITLVGDGALFLAHDAVQDAEAVTLRQMSNLVAAVPRGTITGVTAGEGLTGNGYEGNVTLGVNFGVVANRSWVTEQINNATIGGGDGVAGVSSIQVESGLTGGGSGGVTLGVDPSVVALVQNVVSRTGDTMSGTLTVNHEDGLIVNAPPGQFARLRVRVGPPSNPQNATGYWSVGCSDVGRFAIADERVALNRFEIDVTGNCFVVAAGAFLSVPGNVTSDAQIRSNGGRIISDGTGIDPTVTVWNRLLGAAGMFYGNPGTPSLCFGGMSQDGAYVGPLFAWMDQAANFTAGGNVTAGGNGVGHVIANNGQVTATWGARIGGPGIAYTSWNDHSTAVVWDGTVPQLFVNGTPQGRIVLQPQIDQAFASIADLDRRLSGAGL